jgi:hypothetical protein
MVFRTLGRWIGLSAVGLFACGSDVGTGKLLVQLAAEETISEGLEPGQGVENTKDYGVTYSKYLVAIGRVKLGGRAGAGERVDETVYVADMMKVGETGLDLVEFDDLDAGQWSAFGFETPAAAPGAKMLAGVSDADAQVMMSKGLTYWIEGTVERPEKPVRFSFQVRVPTVFSDCQSDGEPGVAVGEGGRSAATITLHGDHLWFDSFLSGSEASIVRRAKWLADADVDGDGKVVTEDLASVRPEVVFKNYSFAGAPIPIETALDFVRAQLATQGHVNDEGECSAKL